MRQAQLVRPLGRASGTGILGVTQFARQSIATTTTQGVINSNFGFDLGPSSLDISGASGTAVEVVFTGDAQSTRLEALEREVSQLRSLLHSLLVATQPARRRQASATEVAQLRAVLPQIRTLVSVAFGVPETVVETDLQAFDGTDDSNDGSSIVHIDLAKADWNAISGARIAGARIAFYDAIIGSVPSEMLDRTEFRFQFPDE